MAVNSNIDLKQFSPDDLIALHTELSRLIKPKTLMDINLEHELILQHGRTTQLIERLLNDDDTPANQKAQLINSCTQVLQQLAKMQNEVFGSEKVKRLEQAFIRTLKQLPNADEALTVYKNIAANL